MPKQKLTEQNLENILEQYEQDQKWLLSLIRDPLGERTAKDKIWEVRLAEFQQQLKRIDNFLDYIGNPHMKFNSIHVAGTSGKGSVVAMLSCILTSAGLKTGYHISPYLQVCNEKLIVDREMISPSEFSELVEEFRELYYRWVEQNQNYAYLKYGEAWVSLTYFWLARKQVDWGVIETGLGGRYDPTNVLPSSMAVITDLGLDHMKTLGPSLKDITRQKAGIIKKDSLVVTSVTDHELLDIIREEANLKNAKLFSLDNQFSYRVKRNGSSEIEVSTPFNEYSGIQVPLLGKFQGQNAALAVTAADILCHHEQIPITSKIIVDGLEEVKYPGRMEIVQENPIVILDGAHNQPKMKALSASLKELYPGAPVTAVIGFLETKNAEGMIRELAALATDWIATEPHVFGKRSLRSDSLANLILQLKSDANVKVISDISAAVERAIGSAAQGGIILVTGSIYLIGEAREKWYPSRSILEELEHRN